jgi:sulfite exporter TauE/SafE
MNFGLAIALGVLGSLHCAAMCGPLQLMVPLPPGGPGRVVAGRLVYQLGRLGTYVLLGAVAGLLGKSVLLIGVQRWLSLGLGVAILAGFFLSKRVAVSLPAVRLVGWLKTAMSGQLQRRTFGSLALLGALNGLLPCGLVYTALAAAVTTGSASGAILFMGLFGAGTVPLMLAISLSGRILPLEWRMRLRRAIPVGVCLLAGLLIVRGLALGIPYLSPDLAAGGCCAR